MFYQGVPIDHCTHDPGPVSQYSSEIEYNAAFNTGMDLAHLKALNNELLNKYSDVVPEQAPLFILYDKSAVYMTKSGKDTKPTRNVSRRMHLV